MHNRYLGVLVLALDPPLGDKKCCRQQGHAIPLGDAGVDDNIGLAVLMPDFEAAIERIIAGLEKRNRLLNPRERAVVAHHEMGHAIVAMALPSTDPVQKVSIIPRGVGALGYTIQRPLEDRFLLGRGELLDRIAVLLAGRAAERLVFGEISTGAADDLVKATEIARGMVARFGMAGDDLGEVAYEPEQPAFLGQVEWRPRRYGEATATRIDDAVRELVETASDRAEAILAQNRHLLGRAASDLLARETLGEDDLRAIREELVSEAAVRRSDETRSASRRESSPPGLSSPSDLRAGADPTAEEVSPPTPRTGGSRA